MRSTICLIAAASTLACQQGTLQPHANDQLPRAATPAFTPPADTYTTAQTVRVTSDTPDAVLHCTRDGSAPTAASPACPDPIAVTSTTTVRAIATADGYPESDVATGIFTIQPAATPAEAPTFSPDPAVTYSPSVSVTLGSATAGATIRCTTNGTPASASSPTCTSPLAITTTTTIRAVATAPGHTVSLESQATYRIQGTAARAATPTFSPPGGVYSANQSVHVSTTTAGATLRCTTNGVDPTAASPVCADPIVVSSTAGSTTLKAIATAPGWSSSAVGSATYTFDSGAEPSEFDCLLALSTERQLLAHNSVGYNILLDQGGLNDIVAANAAAGVVRVANPANAAAVPPGTWADDMVQSNTHPLQKIDDFDAQFRTRFNGELTHAGFKFCFVDFYWYTDIAPIWARYQEVMNKLEADFPGRIVHWTLPIEFNATTSNVVREQMNQHIRDTYGATGRVFDLAYYESHQAAGACVRDGVPEMCSAYSADGGHLNATGAARMAHAYLMFMCRVNGRY